MYHKSEISLPPVNSKLTGSSEKKKTTLQLPQL